ncbi:MAG: hypothetical protein P8Z37_00385 [Acidobacteriota bacterium]
MPRTVVVLSLMGMLLTCAAYSATAAECERTMLQKSADAYVDALNQGTPSRMPLSEQAVYIENRQSVPFEDGLWQNPLKIDFHRSILDIETCETFTEIVSATGSHPYVIGTRLKIKDDRIVEIEALVTDEDDWLFNAETYLQYSPRETWDVLPIALRRDRKTLIAAANAYFDVFKDSSTVADVPWNIPCARLEGGIYSNPTDDPEASCTGGPPLEGSIDITHRRFIVDPAMGSVVGLVNFGDANGWPDTHMFRLESGKIRYIHTLTVCPDGCELPATEE